MSKFWKKLSHQIQQHFDIYILILVSILGTFFSMTGFLPKDVESGALVALLGLVAVSQLRGRFQIENIASTWHRKRTEIFSVDFPPIYQEAQENVSTSYFYSGETMGRTMQVMRPHIHRILKKQGSVRILLPNPDNQELMEAIAKTHTYKDAQSIKNAIKHSFQTAEACANGNSKAELRTTDVMPHIGVNGWDIKEPSGKIMVQMYEYKPDSTERAPIFILEATDGEWFRHFSNQIERLWADGREYLPNEGTTGVAH